jgi:hypothetical protein
MEGLCFITSVTGLNRPNAGKDNDNSDEYIYHGSIATGKSDVLHHINLFTNKVTDPVTTKFMKQILS